MFWRKEKNKKKDTDYEISSENLAVPEIHIGKKKAEKPQEHEEPSHDSITYDDVAIPEVHIPVRKKK